MNWEDLCNRCGQCCYRLVETDSGYVRHTELHCHWFDPSSKQCTIYRDRFRLAPYCRELMELHIPDYAESGFLPPDCGYVIHIRKEKK